MNCHLPQRTNGTHCWFRERTSFVEKDPLPSKDDKEGGKNRRTKLELTVARRKCWGGGGGGGVGVGGGESIQEKPIRGRDNSRLQ